MSGARRITAAMRTNVGRTNCDVSHQVSGDKKRQNLRELSYLQTATSFRNSHHSLRGRLIFQAP
jgi:hypothetical protein